MHDGIFGNVSYLFRIFTVSSGLPDASSSISFLVFEGYSALSVIYTAFTAPVRYFRRLIYDQDVRSLLAEVLLQLSTQESFGGYFRNRRSLLRVHHRQVEMQVQLPS